MLNNSPLAVLEPLIYGQDVTGTFVTLMRSVFATKGDRSMITRILATFALAGLSVTSLLAGPRATTIAWYSGIARAQSRAFAAFSAAFTSAADSLFRDVLVFTVS